MNTAQLIDAQLRTVERCLGMAREYAPDWFDTEPLEGFRTKLIDGTPLDETQIGGLCLANRILSAMDHSARRGTVQCRVCDVFDNYDPHYFGDCAA